MGLSWDRFMHHVRLFRLLAIWTWSRFCGLEVRIRGVGEVRVEGISIFVLATLNFAHN